MFGNSKIGVTFNDSIEHLGSNFNKIKEDFLKFHSDVLKKLNDPEFILQKRLISKNKSIKFKINELKKQNIELKTRLRHINQEFKIEKIDYINGDLKSTSNNLKASIFKLTNLHKDINILKKENFQLNNEISNLINSQSQQIGELGVKIKTQTINLEMELNELIQNNHESIQKMEQKIENIKSPINLLENRLQDLDKRLKLISNYKKPRSNITTAITKPNASFANSHLARYYK